MSARLSYIPGPVLDDLQRTKTDKYWDFFERECYTMDAVDVREQTTNELLKLFDPVDLEVRKHLVINI